MKKARKVLSLLSGLACAILFGAVANAQTAGTVTGEVKPHGEISGVVGGSALFPFDDGVVLDGMWGIKAGGFGRGRLGVEGTFEQSIREGDLRYLGGDFVFQFRKHGENRTIPFVHIGAGSIQDENHGLGAISFGVGVKQYLNERVGIRAGVQDRMPFRAPEYHRLDFYAGVVFRF